MTMKRLYAITLLVLCCSATALAQKVESKMEVRYFDVDPCAYIKPIVAELKVDNAKGLISEQVEIKSNQKIDESNLRTYAIYVVTQKHKCDVLVAPTVSMVKEDDKFVIYVTGFAANYENWRSCTDADLNWMQFTPVSLDKKEQKKK